MKTFNIFLPRALIFRMYYYLVDLYQVCSRYAPGAICPDGHMFYIGLYWENMKKSSCLKPQGLESWYLVCSSIEGALLGVLQLCPLGQKMPYAGGSHVLQMYI